MKKITILHISDTDFWGMGKNKGISCIYLPLKESVRRGHEVHYVASMESCRGKGVRYENEEGINIHWFNIPLYPSEIKIKFFRILLVKLYTLLFVIKGTFIAYKIGKKIKPDIVIGNQPRAAIVAYFISRIFKIPNITRFYGTYLCRLENNPLQYLYMLDEIIAWKLPATSYIITDDGTGGDKVARKLRIPKEKINFWRDAVEDIFIPNFSKQEFKKKLGIPESTKLMLSLSRLARWKRVDRTIKAIPKIVERRKEVMFLIVGDGPLREEFEKLAKDLKIEPYVKFVGAVEKKDVKLFLNAADIFISLSELSNLGNPVLEALKCGKCVVALDNGETSTVIKNGENGILIKSEDDAVIQKEFPRIILELLGNEGLRNKIGKAAFEYCRKNFISIEERNNMEINLIEKLA